MHPCISRFREYFQEALNESAFMKMLQNIEECTGLSLSLLAIFCSVFGVLYMFVECGYELMCNAVTIFFPAYCTLLSINGSNELQKKWLVYWMIFSIVTLAEVITRRCFTLHPLYWLGKFVLLLWCCLPMERNGSMLFYNQIVCRIYAKCAEVLVQRRESEESKLSFSGEMDKDEYEDIPSEEETIEKLLAEKRAKGEKISCKPTTSFFSKLKGKKKDKEGSDEGSVKSGASESGKKSILKTGKSLFSKKKKQEETEISEEASVTEQLDSAIKEKSVKSDASSVKSSRTSKSATSSIFGSGKSLFSKKKKTEGKKEEEAVDAASASSNGAEIIHKEETDIPCVEIEAEKTEVAAEESANDAKKEEFVENETRASSKSGSIKSASSSIVQSGKSLFAKKETTETKKEETDDIIVTCDVAENVSEEEETDTSKAEDKAEKTEVAITESAEVPKDEAEDLTTSDKENVDNPQEPESSSDKEVEAAE